MFTWLQRDCDQQLPGLTGDRPQAATTSSKLTSPLQRMTQVYSTLCWPASIIDVSVCSPAVSQPCLLRWREKHDNQIATLCMEPKSQDSILLSFVTVLFCICFVSWNTSPGCVPILTCRVTTTDPCNKTQSRVWASLTSALSFKFNHEIFIFSKDLIFSCLLGC